MKYYRPATLDEYVLLRQTLTGKHVALIAGGTDLMPRYEQGVPLPDHLVDLKKLSCLNQIKVTENQIEIGALTSIQDIHDHPVIQGEFNALYTAAHEFAGAQIRHRGTIGGNICNASPAGDLLSPLYALEATLEVFSAKKQEAIPVSEFITGPGRTTQHDKGLLTTIILARNKLDSHFIKVGLRQSMAISIINLALVFRHQNHSFEYLKIAAGSVAPTVVTLDTFTSAYLRHPERLSDHLNLIDEAIAPIDDIRATAGYRRTVLKNLIKDFLRP